MPVQPIVPSVALSSPPAHAGRTWEGGRLQALGLVPAALHGDVRDAVAGLHFDINLEVDHSVFLARARVEPPSLLLIDADAGGDIASIVTHGRALRPGIHVAVLACYWSDREEALRELADAFLYKPPRRGEWQRALTRLGMPESLAA